ncbi:hypothetical protein NL443_18520 [Bacillus nakamurai]|uniref:hypothetical protein n=1 Tax=Bacillus nakamurai TaxID=1793963 RepID=UPI0020C34E39|nr:hypothetical protein [Bacillus nakamurai]MCP6684054.1 hypothetical protein [Bacillus nakamurai]
MSVSKKTLYKKERKNRVKLCTLLRIAGWGKTECERASSSHSRLPEHEEDCHIPNQAEKGCVSSFSIVRNRSMVNENV